LTFASEDIQTLAEMLADIRDATSPRPVAGYNKLYYFIPTKAENTDIIASIINKYNLPAQKYLSSQYADTPVIRIPKAPDIIQPLNILIAKIRTAQANQIQTIFSRPDYNKLIKMMSRTSHARSINRHGKEEMFIYYIPGDKEYTDKALAIFKKYKLPAKLHMSSLNNRQFPVIRVPLNPQTSEAFQNLEIVRDAKTKHDALKRGRTNVLQKLLNKVQRAFGDEYQK